MAKKRPETTLEDALKTIRPFAVVTCPKEWDVLLKELDRLREIVWMYEGLCK